MPKIHAHRGASAYAPENTMEAFKMAVSMKADYIELDVHLTKDKKIVVTHDDCIERVSDGKGFVGEYTYNELLKFNFNNHKQDYGYVKIPLLEEVYDLVKDTPVNMNVEIKSDYGEIEKMLFELEKASKMEERVIYSSFNHYSLKEMLEQNPNAKTGLLYYTVLYRPALYANICKAYALHGAFRTYLFADIISECKELNIKNNIWTVDREDEIRRCVELGADGIITNRPDVALEICNKLAGAYEKNSKE